MISTALWWIGAYTVAENVIWFGLGYLPVATARGGRE
jgi:hypothetical protein